MDQKDLSRRTFLTAAGAVTAGALVGCGAAGGGAGTFGSMPPPADLKQIRREHFDALVGEPFTVWHPEHGAGEIVLRNVIDRTEVAQVPPEASHRDPFSLEFDGLEGTCPEADHYSIEHPAIGEHELYLLTLPPVDQTGLYDIHLD